MKSELLCWFISCALGTFLLTALGLKKAIPILKSKKMGQKILDIGPRWHKGKEGTPTMGGIVFIIASLIVFAVSAIVMAATDRAAGLGKMLICILFALANGLIGIVDDMTKFAKNQNKGLSASQKYLLQLVLAGAFLFVMRASGYISTSLYIPYVNTYLELGWFYYVFALVLITGIVNSVNLTDGIDGLCSTVTFVVGGFFAVAAFRLESLPEVVVSALAIGATLGFLVYNAYPAKVFMGDTGSLFLGGLVVALAFMIDDPLILLPVGIVYVCESLSDIIQVGYFKLTHGKRFFKMAPIHHHFEKCGWSENKIVFVFSLITALFSVIAFFGLAK